MTQKPSRKPKGKSERRSFYGLAPWKCNHLADGSEITAYVEASGTWETVAVIPPTSGASAEALAAFITGIVNAAQQNRDLLKEAMRVLEAVLDDGLTFSTEQEAASVAASIRRVIS